MVTLVTQLILRELDKKQEVTLDHLFNIISRYPQIKLERSVLKHRIRANLYSLEHSKKVKRVDRATFSKT